MSTKEKPQVSLEPKRYKTIRMIIKEYGLSRPKIYELFNTNRLKRLYLDSLIMINVDELESILCTESTWGHTPKPVKKGNTKISKRIKQSAI